MKQREKWSDVTKREIRSKAGMTRSNPSLIVMGRQHSSVTMKTQKMLFSLMFTVQQVYHNRTIKTPKPRLPTISVLFIHGKYGNEELLDVLRQQNEEQGIHFNTQGQHPSTVHHPHARQR